MYCYVKKIPNLIQNLMEDSEICQKFVVKKKFCFVFIFTWLKFQCNSDLTSSASLDVKKKVSYASKESESWER